MMSLWFDTQNSAENATDWEIKKKKKLFVLQCPVFNTYTNSSEQNH